MTKVKTSFWFLSTDINGSSKSCNTPKSSCYFLFTLSVLFLCFCCASAGPIAVKRTRFDTTIKSFFYFEKSPIVLYLDASGTVFRSGNEGETWARVENVPKNVAINLIQHPFSNDRAYILTQDKTHYKTTDKGASWTEFTTPIPPARTSKVLSFHAARDRYVLFRGTECKDSDDWTGKECYDETYYTKTDFDEPPKLLLTHTDKCLWAHSTLEFTAAPILTIYCIEYASSNGGSIRKLDDYHLVESSNLFSDKTLVKFGTGSNVNGVVDLALVKKYLVAAVKRPNSEGMTMYVSSDGDRWAKASFPHKVGFEEDSYTLLESETTTLVVDVFSSSSSGDSATLFFSNSDGTNFVNRLNHTNRNSNGLVDFERVQGVEGIILVNTVKNWEQIGEGSLIEKKLQTKISFEDGARWIFLKPPPKGADCNVDEYNTGRCSLHLHSITDPHNSGHVFSSSSAPGVLLGVGNVGEYLLPYDQCDTFFSYDGGLSWELARTGAHKYEIGDMGSLLVLIDDEQPTDYILYSSDHGNTWKNHPLDLDGRKIRARILTTDPKSTSQKFLLFGSVIQTHDDDGSFGRYQMIQLDFTNLFSLQCDENDFEEWYARSIDGDPDCLMGHKTAYMRRKANAQCYVGKEFQKPKRIDEVCPCTDEDYECDFNYILNEENCVLLGPEYIPDGECKDGGEYLGSSGWRLIPGDNCETNGKGKNEPIMKKCPENQKPDGVILTPNEPIEIQSFMYFPDSKVIMAKNFDGKVYRSRDEGSEWKHVSQVEFVASMILHEHNDKMAYFFSENGKLWYTEDRGENFSNMNLPAEPNKLNINNILDFHPEEKNWLIFVGSKQSPKMHTEVYYTKDNGNSWEPSPLETWAQKCIFGRDDKFSKVSKNSIFCSSYKDKNSDVGQDILDGRSTIANPLQLIRTDIFGKERTVLFNDIVEFLVFNQFMIVASEVNGELLLHVSMDGNKFEQAVFPPHIKVEKDAFTILQSTTGSIFLDASESTKYGAEYGSLFKSDSTGVTYSLSLNYTNRDIIGTVDFEQVQGLKGVILANQLLNAEGLTGNVKKKVRTKISFDDGSSWQDIDPPKRDLNGKPWKCTEDCHLNLHGRSEIYGPGAVFSAPSAVGLLAGVGNVGPYLLPYTECTTFLSRDAGRTWKEVQRAESKYEFGDQGTITVVVDDEKPTKDLLYSWDYGESWKKHEFHGEDVRVTDLTTNPNSTSLKFLLRGHTIQSDTKDAEPILITIDFTQLEPRRCKFDKDVESNNDFELFDPMEGQEDECLLGQKIKYWRRKATSKCRIDNQKILEESVQKCKCTERDFECDINYWRNDSGKCVLYGYDQDRPFDCKPGDTYLGRSGYRKIHGTQCEGGENLEGNITKTCQENQGIIVVSKTFDSTIAEFFYFDGENPDVVLMRTSDNKVWKSENQGYTWEQLKPNQDEDVEIISIIQHPYSNKHAYFITRTKTHYMTDNQGESFGEITVPSVPNSLDIPILDFHPTKFNWLIYTGSEDCEATTSPNCRAIAFYSKNNGQTWDTLIEYVRICSWARDKKFITDDNLIFCESYKDKYGSQRTFVNNPLEFSSSANFFRKSSKLLFPDTIGFATFQEFMVVAELRDSSQDLRLMVSHDGDHFSEAQFPPNMKITNRAYNILESTTHSILLHVTAESRRHDEWGNILKSDSNGTQYILSLEYVNRNDAGYVDFEKMQGIPGIALANVVKNVADVNIGGGVKQLKSMITFNDGGTWKPLNPPKVDANEQEYPCDNEQTCTLHLHSFTEWKDQRDSFSSSSAVGLMMGVGNVGDHLSSYENGNTYLTRDAGVTWQEIKKGAYLHEIGDQGAIIVIVDDIAPTDHVLYSFDEGLSWNSLPITKKSEPVRVRDIATVTDGTSRKFILWGNVAYQYDKEIAIHLDFTGLLPTQCKLKSDDPESDDFELWSPQLSSEEKCLFGQEISYNRRIREHKCYIGEKIHDQREVVTETCPCTEHDFECDFNYIRNADGKCVLAPGAKPLERTIQELCANGDKYYYGQTEYRRIPQTKCSGGKELDKGVQLAPCPGQGFSTGMWIIIILSPFIIVGLLTFCFVYSRRDRFGYSLLGQVQLGESTNSILSTIMSGALTGLATVIDLIASVRVPDAVSRFFGNQFNAGRRRSSFNRPSYSYAPVAQDDSVDVLMDDYDIDNESL